MPERGKKCTEFFYCKSEIVKEVLNANSRPKSKNVVYLTR